MSSSTTARITRELFEGELSYIAVSVVNSLRFDVRRHPMDVHPVDVLRCKGTADSIESRSTA